MSPGGRETGPLAEGTIFAGRYRIGPCLAAGGMGAVYEAVHVETRRRRALKVMHPHLFQSAEMRARFMREARIAADVESEYIVDVSDAGVDEETRMPFLVMDLLRGEELGERIARVGPLPPAEALTHLEQVALALDRTHARDIVHRDLKPENLFVTTREDGTSRIKILDFGLAKVVAEGASGAAATREMGTPLYMAPEQFRAGARLGPAADIYALGLTAYTLLVGAAYFREDAETAGEMIAFALVASQGPKEPATARAARRGIALPPSFDAWFARATAVDPAARFPSATAAVRALAGALGHSPRILGPASREAALAATAMAARPDLAAAGLAAATTVAAAVPPPPRRSRAALVTAAVVGAAVVGGGAWGALRATAGDRHRPEPAERSSADRASASASAAPSAIPAERAAIRATATAASAAPPSPSAAASAPPPRAPARKAHVPKAKARPTPTAVPLLGRD